MSQIKLKYFIQDKSLSMFFGPTVAVESINDPHIFCVFVGRSPLWIRRPVVPPFSLINLYVKTVWRKHQKESKKWLIYISRNIFWFWIEPTCNNKLRYWPRESVLWSPLWVLSDVKKRKKNYKHSLSLNGRVRGIRLMTRINYCLYLCRHWRDKKNPTT